VLFWLAVRPTLPAPPAALAQGLPEKPAAVQLTVEDIEARIKQLADAQDLDDAVKGKIQELYQQALGQLELVKNASAQASLFERMAASSREELAGTKAELAALPSEPPPVYPDGSLVELEGKLLEKETELVEKRSSLAELEGEAKRRAGRRLEIPKLVLDAKARLAELEKQQQAAPAEEPPQLIAARQVLAAARRQALEQELLAYDKEPKAYEARTEVLPLRRDLAARQVGLLEREVALWRQLVNSRRQRETEAQLDKARWEARQAHPALARLAENNKKLAERRSELAELISKTIQQWEQTNKKLAAIEDQFTRTKEKIDTVDTIGLTDAMGLMLRKQRDALPDLREYRRNVAARQVTIRDGQLELLDLEDRRSELANLERQVQDELQEIAQGLSKADRSELEAALREALEAEKRYLDALIVDANSHFDRLVDLDTAERLLIQQTEQYAKYADERVLWIRSTPAYGPGELRHAAMALAWLGDPESWSLFARSLLVDCWRNPHLLAIALVLFAPLVYGRGRLRRKITEIGGAAERATCCRFFPTVRVLCLTVLLAIAWPGVLWYLAWRLNVAADASEFSKSVAAALVGTAGAYLGLELLRYLCREDGLAQAHFDWPGSSLRVVRMYARWATLLVLPLIFIALVMDSQGNERWTGALGRLSFAAALVVCSLFAWRALRANGGVYQAVLTARQRGWLDRLRIVWYPLAWMVPLVMASLAMAGYYYTARQLAGRTMATVWMLFGLVLLRSLLLRWVLVKRRSLAMEQARQRRAASQAEAEPAGESAAVPVIPTPAEPNLDLATINTQTRHLVEYSLAVAGFLGVWFIWVGVLPALRILDRVELWQTLGQAEAVTLADLGLAALIFSTALIAARNVPGLLEMTLLQRLPIDAGFRYTIGTVSRYLVTVVGVVAACHVLGLGWAKVQWLVAAISVGLGFGLQEIFANFVSGLIILFERPVRVGDVVTVADVTGVVSRIRMRATTITNWDRKEFIVPNKEFITGRLLNWTLSDRVNRIVVNVGIAYGSDTQLAAQLLKEVAEEHPLVLEDPPPRITFEGFGDNSLNFVLRCYLPDLESRLDVIHDLHMNVDAAFRRAGIEIAFPQRDIHVRSIDTKGMALFDRAADSGQGVPKSVEEDKAGNPKSRRVA